MLFILPVKLAQYQTIFAVKYVINVNDNIAEQLLVMYETNLHNYESQPNSKLKFANTPCGHLVDTFWDRKTNWRFCVTGESHFHAMLWTLVGDTRKTHVLSNIMDIYAENNNLQWIK